MNAYQLNACNEHLGCVVTHTGLECPMCKELAELESEKDELTEQCNKKQKVLLEVIEGLKKLEAQIEGLKSK